MKDLFSKASNLSDAIFGSGNQEPQKKSVPIPEKKEWDFGTMQPKIKIENERLSWNSFGEGGSSYPLASVQGIQYEKGPMLTWMSHMVVLAAGGDNRRIQIPKSEKSEQIIQEVNLFIQKSQEKSKPEAITASAQADTTSIADELIKLASLKQQGILTEDEFQQQKQKLLSR